MSWATPSMRQGHAPRSVVIGFAEGVSLGAGMASDEFSFMQGPIRTEPRQEPPRDFVHKHSQDPQNTMLKLLRCKYIKGPNFKGEFPDRYKWFLFDKSAQSAPAVCFEMTLYDDGYYDEYDMEEMEKKKKEENKEENEEENEEEDEEEYNYYSATGIRRDIAARGPVAHGAESQYVIDFNNEQRKELQLLVWVETKFEQDFLDFFHFCLEK